MEKLQDGLDEILRASNKFDALGSITENELAQYVAQRRLDKTPQGKIIAPATVNREIQLLRRIMRRAVVVWKHTLALPDWKTVLLSEPEEHVVNIGRDLEQKIIERMRPDFRPAMRFLVMSGLRAGSVLLPRDGQGRGPLRPEHVDFDTGMIIVSSKSKRPGGKVMRIPITRAMKILLANELGNHADAVFTYEAARTEDGRIRGQRYPIAYGTFYHEFKIAAKEAGRSDLRPHDLRHTAATRTLMETGNMRLAQQQLGHTRLSTTERYTHPLVEDLRAALEAVHISEPATEQNSETAANHLIARRKSRRANRS
jgi:integrase